MNARNLFEAVPCNGTGTLMFLGELDDCVAWQHFASQVKVLEDLAGQGLLTICIRRRERYTGDANVDMVVFQRGC